MFKILFHCYSKNIFAPVIPAQCKYISLFNDSLFVSRLFRQFSVVSKVMNMGDGSRKSSTESVLDVNDKKVTFSDNFRDNGKSDGNDPTKFSVLEGEYFDDCVDTQPITPSTTADEQKVIDLLKEVISYQDKQLSSWIVEVGCRNRMSS